MRAGIPALLLTILLAGCGSYADFTLPVLSQKPGAVEVKWSVSPAPVLAKSDAAWEAVDVLNPSVLNVDGALWNFYSGFDGKTWHTGLATSSDGLRWQRQGAVLSPDPTTWEGDYIAANGSALRRGQQIMYWYQGGRIPSIGLAVSKDGRNWTRQPAPVLQTGPRGSWDERGVADSYVIESGNLFFMYYLGQDRAQRQRIGVARSADGIHWQKLRANPVLELGAPGSFDEIGLGEPAVWAQQGSWWMLYTGRDTAERRSLGLARSQDGVHWMRVSESAILAGSAPWDAKVVCDPTVIPKDDGTVRVWFGGGDAAQPAENLHGQIGYAELHISIH
jgi:predicted GH43/DUF377 family glycosyl hydrolase